MSKCECVCVCVSFLMDVNGVCVFFVVFFLCVCWGLDFRDLQGKGKTCAIRLHEYPDTW